MNSETNQPAAAAASPESEVNGMTIPIWLVVLTVVLLYWGAMYFDENGGWFNSKVYTPFKSYAELEKYIPRDEGPSPRRGEALFAPCSQCHGADGAGKPGQAPPLAGSDWVTAKGVNRLIRIPVLGLNGPITVKGQPYDFAAGMTAVYPNGMRTILKDADLADILTYIRQAWGNKAGPVTAAQVKAVRDEIGNRSTMLTVKELQDLPEEK